MYISYNLPVDHCLSHMYILLSMLSMSSQQDTKDSCMCVRACVRACVNVYMYIVYVDVCV